MCNTVRHKARAVKRALCGALPVKTCVHRSAHGWCACTPGSYRLAYLTDYDGGMPVMTIRVYEVNCDGVTRVVREETEVVPLERPEASHRFPACECPRCKTPAQ